MNENNTEKDAGGLSADELLVFSAAENALKAMQLAVETLQSGGDWSSEKESGWDHSPDTPLGIAICD